MDARTRWDQYVEDVGGLQKVAVHLETAYSTVAGISNGSRGIGRKLAIRFAENDTRLSADWLVWVRPTKATDAQQHIDVS